MTKKSTAAVIEAPESEAEKITEIIITSAEQMSSLLKEELFAHFFWRGRSVKVPITPMSPKTSDAVRELNRKALPPFKRDRGAQGAYDDYDPAYLKAREENIRKARSLAIYTHCPVVAQIKAGLVNVDEIHAFVQTLWTENILEIISLKIQEGGLSLEPRVDFTSAGGLES